MAFAIKKRQKGWPQAMLNHAANLFRNGYFLGVHHDAKSININHRQPVAFWRFGLL
jgi:hypothetical protein